LPGCGGSGDPVDERPGQIHDDDRDKSLRKEQTNPCSRPVGGSLPDQLHCPVQVWKCVSKAPEISAYRRFGLFSPAAHSAHHDSYRCFSHGGEHTKTKKKTSAGKKYNAPPVLLSTRLSDSGAVLY
jgi:hypothetical protein